MRPLGVGTPSLQLPLQDRDLAREAKVLLALLVGEPLQVRKPLLTRAGAHLVEEVPVLVAIKLRQLATPVGEPRRERIPPLDESSELLVEGFPLAARLPDGPPR